jgi:hypothetical protein
MQVRVLAWHPSNPAFYSVFILGGSNQPQKNELLKIRAGKYPITARITRPLNVQTFKDHRTYGFSFSLLHQGNL